MPKISRGGHEFEGYDKPIRTPGHSSGKSHAVIVRVDGKPKLIRFGAQGATTKRPQKGESDADKAKRRSFKARHAKKHRQRKNKCRILGKSRKVVMKNNLMGFYG